MGDAPTHAVLVVLAARWLHSTMGCTLVVTERLAPGTDEAPDAIGWTTYDGQRSILVECKVSLEDWRADQVKPSRAAAAGMGRERWYLTPAGLLAGRELNGWGWAEVRGGKVYRRVEPVSRATPEVRTAEYPLLLAIARRALQGIRDGCSLDSAELARRAQVQLPLGPRTRPVVHKGVDPETAARYSDPNGWKEHF